MCWTRGWRGAVLADFLFPIHFLLQIRLAMRLTAAMVLLAAPLFFAALIFARSFKGTQEPDLAFASNTLGAVIGGLLEYTSLVIGFRPLFLIALALYALSYVALFLSPKRARMFPA